MAANVNNAVPAGCFTNLTTTYNKYVGMLANKTFAIVTKLQIKESDGVIGRVAKFFAAFISCATLIPLIGLFAAKWATAAAHTILGKMQKQNPEQQPPAQQAQPIVDAQATAGAANVDALPEVVDEQAAAADVLNAPIVGELAQPDAEAPVADLPQPPVVEGGPQQ